MFELSAGQIVADKYRIDAVIGSGGMGVVVSATHLDLDQRVAIKLLRDASPESIARFAREARLIVRLKSQHVARVFDVGSLDDDTPFIVMELLEGEDLSTTIESRGRLPVEQAVDWILEACEAVAEAHSLGMVHRDLKPANIFIAQGPGATSSVKVLDFGISKNLEELTIDGTSGGLTNDGAILGSPGYMSPEQMNSARDVDERADIYSLGAILYRLTGGQNPYKGDSLMAVLAAMAMTSFPPLRSLVPDVPEAFALVVERCLSQDARTRPPNVAELALALAPFATRRGRASIEQITATLGVAETLHGSAPRDLPRAEPGTPLQLPPPTSADTFGATIVSPISAPPARSAPSLPAPIPPPQPIEKRAPTKKSSTNVLIALAGLSLLMGTIAWASFFREPAAANPATQPADSNGIPTAPVQQPPPTTPVVITPPSPIESTPRPADSVAKKSAPTKPPHHPPTSQPHVHKAPTGSAPPSPTDVPDGRR